MKKVLFLVDEFIDYYQLLIKEGNQLDLNLTINTFDEIAIDFTQKLPNINLANVPLKNFDLIYIRSVGKYRNLLPLISSYANYYQIPLYDPIFRNDIPWKSNKNYQYLIFQKNSLSIIPSISINGKQINQVEKLGGYPCIVKIPDVSQGEGVFLCKNKEQLLEIFDKFKHSHLLIQKFVKSQSDLRIFVVGQKVVAAIERSSNSKTEFRHNVSLGGTAVAYQAGNKEIELAIKATKVLGYSISGVDLIFNPEQKQWNILEVNKAPQFTAIMKASGVNIPFEIMNYFKKELIIHE